MKTLFATTGLMILLATSPALAETTSSPSTPSMTVLSTTEREELKNCFQTSQNEVERNKVRTEIQERVRTQELLNSELAPGYRNQLTTQEQQAVRKRLGTAQTDDARQEIIAKAQALAQSKLRFRTNNAYSLHRTPQVTEQSGNGQYIPLK